MINITIEGKNIINSLWIVPAKGIRRLRGKN